jgi:glucokinase
MTRRGGLDLGGTKIQAAIVDDAMSVVGAARVETPRENGPAGVAAAMADVLREAAAQAGVETRDLIGVGVGSPGAIDAATGDVSHANNVAEWDERFPLGATLRDALGTPVVVGNDVSVATAAEFQLGAGAPYRSLLGVFWGTGVGGGLILDGHEWHGRGAAGEIGHMVVELHGAQCACGRRGCLEAYAGRGAMEVRARELHAKGHRTDLFRIMRRRGRTRLASGVWAEALEHGDHVATELIERAIDALGATIASVINLLDIEAVVIGGGLGTRLGAPYATRIAVAMQPHLFVPERPPAVRVAALGDLGGAIGAALQVPVPAHP